MWWRAFNGSCTQESGTAHRFNFYSSGIAGVHGVRLHRPITDGTSSPGAAPLYARTRRPCPAPGPCLHSHARGLQRALHSHDDPARIHTDGPLLTAAQRAPPPPLPRASRAPVSARETRFRAPPAREVRGPAAGNGGGAPIADLIRAAARQAALSSQEAAARRGVEARRGRGAPAADLRPTRASTAARPAGGPPVTLFASRPAVLRSPLPSASADAAAPRAALLESVAPRLHIGAGILRSAVVQ